MASLLLVPAAIVYLLVVVSLFIYGINFYYLTFLAVRRRRAARLQPPAIDQWPRVTVQLPIYNEMYVARRLIEAAAAIAYPPQRLEIQVLDDSTDRTVEIVAQTVRRLRTRGMDISHIHRSQRDGYKAGALRDGLKCATGDYIAIFDADFIPTHHFLKETLPHFLDERVAFVQTRWDYANRDYSLLTYFQSLSIDAHFMVEQFSRSQSGYWFNFNGTAGIWRKIAIEDAGGWQPHTLTEDLDLSYRAFMKGWQAVYLRDVSVPSEIPVTFSAFRRQQHRWARGSLENAVILLPKIWRSDFPLKTKIQASLHLTGYLVHLLLFALCIIYPVVILLSMHIPALVSLFGITIVLNVTGLAPTLFFLVAQSQLGRAWWRTLPAVLFITAFGGGMMLNTVRAALEMVRGTAPHFERTPKLGITRSSQPWREKHYRLGFDKIVFWEMLLGLFNLGSCLLALRFHHWFISFYALLFAIGLFFTSIYTLVQSIHALQKT